MTDDALILNSGTAQCTLYPGIGGSLGGWTVDGQDILHAVSDEDVASRDPLRMSSFPLVPYSNRIGDARFDWAGDRVQLAPNFPPEPHAIHGVGWKRRWGVVRSHDDMVQLRYEHKPDTHWPWAFTAEQTITLSGTSLTLNLRARNDHGTPVPLAFGHHPYFDAAGARLHFDAARVWMSGADALPTEAIAPAGDFDFRVGAEVEGRAVDHCYAGWTGATRIDWARRAYTLEITATPSLPAAVIYIPNGGDNFCFEPVPHINNALNLAGKVPTIPIIEPGEWFTAAIIMQALRR